MAEATDDMEMKERSEQEAGEQEGEDETNVDDDRRHGDESILIIDGSNPVFARPDADTDTSEGPGGSVPNVGRDVGGMRRSMTDDKKRFLKDRLGENINKGDGPSSTILYDGLKVEGDKNGKVNGAKYKGKKVLILKKGGKIGYSEAQAMISHVKEFEELIEKARKEHQKTTNAQVEEKTKAKGLDTSEEHTESVLEETYEAIDKRISELRDKALSNNPNITANERREMENIFSPKEYREMGGTAKEKPVELTGGMEVDKDLIDGKLEGYKENAKHWKELAEKEGEGSTRRLAFELAEQASELLGDKLRLETNQRVQSQEALNIMEETIENNDLTKLQKFRQWARENLLELSAVAISVAGILTTVIMAGRSALKRGAQAVSKFGKAVANIAKKFGPILSAIGTLISKVLTLGAQGILFLAQNLWILVLALTYFIYNEYMSRRGSRTAKRRE